MYFVVVQIQPFKAGKAFGHVHSSKIYMSDADIIRKQSFKPKKKAYCLK